MMKRKFAHLKKHHQLFVSLLILSGIVCLWRGMWGLLDMYFLANDPSLSYVLSVTIGIFVIAITHYTIDSLV